MVHFCALITLAFLSASRRCTTYVGGKYQVYVRIMILLFPSAPGGWGLGAAGQSTLALLVRVESSVDFTQHYNMKTHLLHRRDYLFIPARFRACEGDYARHSDVLGLIGRPAAFHA